MAVATSGGPSPDPKAEAGEPPRRAGFSAPGGDFGTRLQQLAHVTAELAAAETIEAVVDIAVTRFATVVRAEIVTLLLSDETTLTLVGTHGMHPELAKTWASFAIDTPTPAAEAARTGAPVLIADTSRIDQRYPAVQGAVPAGRSVVCLPLSAGQKPLGVIGLSFDEAWVPGPRELDFLTTFADACAQALRRIHATEAGEEKAAQLAFLAEASGQLASSLNYRATLAQVAKLAVRSLSDWCAVDILHDGELTTLAVEHVDPAKVAWAWELQERYPPDRNGPTGAPNVVRTGVSELFADITDDMLVAGARDEEHLRLARELKLNSAMVVPLSARGRTLGAITLIRAGGGRRFSQADLAVAEDLGRRAGVAIDNALLYSQTQDVALQLQRAVLPDKLPSIDGWQIATHYSPGGHAEVGGDFYDAILLPDGAMAVVIGDVMGHGVAAAAAMAHMRASVRAFLTVDPDPAVVVGKLDRMFAQLGITQLVSLVYAVIDPVASQLRLITAGHHPPLLISPDGRTRFAECAPQRILGAGPVERVASTIDLEPGCTVLLYTDGLIERRDEDHDAGLGRLAANAGPLASLPLSIALDDLVESLCRQPGSDDVTAIAVRSTAPHARTS